MDIAWLLDFIALSRTLNFTRAAEDRHVTQSAFSRRIKALERWVGTPLIDRSAYPVRLLPAGDDFLPVAQTAIDDLHGVRSDLRSRMPEGGKFQTFAAPHAVSTHHLAPLLRTLEGKLAAVRTRVFSDDLHSCSSQLVEGNAEFLLCYRHPDVMLTLDESRFDRIDIDRDCLLPVCVPDASGAPSWTLPGRRDAPVPLLAYAPGSYFGALVELALQRRPAHVKVRHMDAFSDALKALALLGHGVAWLPQVAVAQALETGHLLPAAGAKWRVDLTLSVFAATKRLDRDGLQLWEHFGNVSRRADGTRHVSVPAGTAPKTRKAV